MRGYGLEFSLNANLLCEHGHVISSPGPQFSHSEVGEVHEINHTKVI